MAQYPIPQFIEEEGRIVFFLTYSQFFFLVGGGAACLVLYLILPFWIFVILGIFIILLVAAIAFIKINNESIVKVLLHAIGFSISTKNYVWEKKELNYPITDTPQSQLYNTKKIIDTKK